MWLTSFLWVNTKESKLFSKRFISFQPTSTNWFFSVNCCSSGNSFTIYWGFWFTALSEVALSISRQSLIQALLQVLYEKGYYDHHCLHGSHNAKKMPHRLDLCCCSHHLDHVQTLWVDKWLRSSEHQNRSVGSRYLSLRSNELLGSLWLFPQK